MTRWVAVDNHAEGDPGHDDAHNAMEDFLALLGNYITDDGQGSATFQQLSAKIGLRVRGTASDLLPIFQVEDFAGAPICWVLPAGGIGVNDNLTTQYSIFGPQGFYADIYGFIQYGQVVRFGWDGPPGNLSSWDEATGEHFQSDRALTLGSWVGVFATATIATHEQDPLTTPHRLRGSWRATNTNASGGATVATVGGASATPVTGSSVYSTLIHVKPASAAATRQAQVAIGWYTSGGSFISNSYGPQINCPSGSWTKLTSGALTAPSNAAFAQRVVLISSLIGETHDLCGSALNRGDISRYSPPFVVRFGQASVGDRWDRTDASSTTDYVCTTGGYPWQQVWAGASGGTGGGVTGGF